MFSDKHDEAVERFVQFSKEPNGDICLDIQENKVNVSDDGLRQLIKQQFGIDAIKICNKMKEKQDEILRVAKAIDGTNIRQIARITVYHQHGFGNCKTNSLSPCFSLIDFDLRNFKTGKYLRKDQRYSRF